MAHPKDVLTQVVNRCIAEGSPILIQVLDQLPGRDTVDALTKWTAKPYCCPYCGTTLSPGLGTWTAQSDDDPSNTAVLTEYQCDGICEGRSLWL